MIPRFSKFAELVLSFCHFSAIMQPFLCSLYFVWSESREGLTAKLLSNLYVHFIAEKLDDRTSLIDKIKQVKCSLIEEIITKQL